MTLAPSSKNEGIHQVACWIASGPRHETKLVVDTLKARFVRALPKKLVGDRAYDSDPLDEELRRDGVEVIAPHRANPSSRRRKIDDG